MYYMFHLTARYLFMPSGLTVPVYTRRLEPIRDSFAQFYVLLFFFLKLMIKFRPDSNGYLKQNLLSNLCFAAALIRCR